MKIFPQKSFALEVDVMPETLCEHIGEHTEEQRWFSRPEEFMGTVSPFEFELSWVNGRRPGMTIPIVTGRMTPTDRGTLVNVTVGPHKMLKLFTYLWFGILTVHTVAGLVMVCSGSMLGLFFLAVDLPLLCVGFGILWWASAEFPVTRSAVEKMLLSANTGPREAHIDADAAEHVPPPLPKDHQT